MLKKSITLGILILLAAFFSVDNHAAAQQMIICTDGIARVGETETEVQAKHRACLDAQQRALEEAGVIVASKTTVVNHQVLEDWLQSVAAARIQSRVLAESRSIEDNAIVFRVKLECKVEAADITLLNQELQKLIIPGGQAHDKVAKKKESVKDFVLTDGSLYTGSLVDGLPDGRGVKQFTDGGRYEGEFRKGFREGTGNFVWSSGASYTGNWLRDKRCGQGEFISAAGEKQAGRWLNDVFYAE
ncbi:MAG: hypothetical protein LLG02_12555 [Pelosinus sp.]|nr:hypothetical protein [Pelosinus sp.]